MKQQLRLQTVLEIVNRILAPSQQLDTRQCVLAVLSATRTTKGVEEVDTKEMSFIIGDEDAIV